MQKLASRIFQHDETHPRPQIRRETELLVSKNVDKKLHEEQQYRIRLLLRLVGEERFDEQVRNFCQKLNFLIDFCDTQFILPPRLCDLFPIRHITNIK